MDKWTYERAKQRKKVWRREDELPSFAPDGEWDDKPEEQPENSPKKRQNQNEGLPPTLLHMQSILCILWLLAVLALRLSGGLAPLRTLYTRYVESGISFSEEGQLSRLASAGAQWVREEAKAVGEIINRWKKDEKSYSGEIDAKEEPAENAWETTEQNNGQGEDALPDKGRENTGTLLVDSMATERGETGDKWEATPLLAAGGPERVAQTVPSTVDEETLLSQAGVSVLLRDSIPFTYSGQAGCAGEYFLSEKPIWPVNGYVSSSFGWREHPITGESDFHAGLDIAAPEGSPVCAAFAGTVTATGYSQTGGLYVKVSHGAQVETIYYHLGAVYFQQGDWVEKGQALGAVGLTGVTTGYHLHFELLLCGLWANPLPALEGTL